MSGNAIPGSTPINKNDVNSVINSLRTLLPNIQIYPIGSAGKKETSDDIDVIIDSRELMQEFPAKELKLSRKSLEDYFKQKGLITARSGVSVHVGIPSKTGIVQVDIMAVENAKDAVPLHTHDYSDQNMKGGTLHAMWADLANLSKIPGHESLMMSPYRGLLDRNTRELITSDKDKIAKIIIGPAASSRDMGNPQLMLSALRNYPDKYRSIKDKYFPEKPIIGTNEWFRNMMDSLT